MGSPVFLCIVGAFRRVLLLTSHDRRAGVVNDSEPLSLPRSLDAAFDPIEDQVKRFYRMEIFDGEVPNRGGSGRFVKVSSDTVWVGMTIPSTLPGSPFGVVFDVMKREIARLEPTNVQSNRLDGRRILCCVDANAQSGRYVGSRFERRRRDERVRKRVPGRSREYRFVDRSTAGRVRHLPSGRCNVTVVFDHPSSEFERPLVAPNRLPLAEVVPNLVNPHM